MKCCRIKLQVVRPLLSSELAISLSSSKFEDAFLSMSKTHLSQGRYQVLVIDYSAQLGCTFFNIATATKGDT
jgi:hypothetical protein